MKITILANFDIYQKGKVILSMESKDYVLFSPVGLTDPIRTEHDGPLLHIIRHYKPQKVYLMLTKEIGEKERKYGTYTKGIELLDSGCEVELFYTEIEKANDFDVFSDVLLKQLEEVKKENPNSVILLNITSATPQIEAALCMIAISDIGLYKAIQVDTPVKKGNRSVAFEHNKDDIEEWFDNNLDNLEDMENRCREANLSSFKKSMIQYQIKSLMEQFDYKGAETIYSQNAKLFTENVGWLLRHGWKRLNLEYEDAEEIARKLELYEELYPVSELNIKKLLEYFLTLEIKQRRGELTDMVLRLEVWTLYFGIDILERNARIKLDDIVNQRGKGQKLLSREKTEKRLPGITKYLDDKFVKSKSGKFEWEKFVSSTAIVSILEYTCETIEKMKPLREIVNEMARWNKLSRECRNPVAHTMVTVTEQKIKDSYDNKESKELIKQIKIAAVCVFKNSLKTDIFDIYNHLNKMITSELEK